MDVEHTAPGTLWDRWGWLARPSLFFLAVIYYEELFFKLYCFRALSVEGAVFTFLFTLPVSMLLGLLCGGIPAGRGRVQIGRAHV